MKKKPLGPTGVEIAVIGQGTWDMERGDRPEVIRAIQRGLDLGLTHIDTAEMYGSGEVETIVGEAIVGRRNELFLVSKVLPQNGTYKKTLAACERSLKRLSTDHLDLYLLHWLEETPLEETIKAFGKLYEDGKILTYGVSNFSVEEISHAVSLAGEGKIACNQVLYHLEERAIEHSVLPWCEEQGIALVGYSPFGQGEFSRIAPRRLRVLEEIAAAHGATSRQVALAFLTRRKSLFAIPKSSQVAHVEENAAALDLALSGAELRQIDETFPLGPPTNRVPML